MAHSYAAPRHAGVTRVRRALLSGSVVLVFALIATGLATTDGAAYQYVNTETPAPEAPLRCGGETVDQAASIKYRTQALIDAPLDVIWNLQADVERWPLWQRAVTSVTQLTDGPLHAQSRFRWTTPVPATPVTPATTLAITSTVDRLENLACIRWSGPAVAEGLTIDRGVHVWTFAEVDGRVLVSTEESWTGEQVEANRDMATSHLGAGLEAWLHDLENAAVR